MKDQRFDSFIDLVKVFPGNSRMREILIKLNYFSEFGGSKKLLKIAELYDKYYGKKIIKKEKCELPIELIQKHMVSETEKQYRFEPEGMLALLSELCDNIPDETLPVLEQINAQNEYLGYIDLIDNTKPTMAIILSINTKFTPKLTLYRLGDGKTTTVKLKKKAYELNPLESGMIIDYRIEKKNKWQMQNGEWVMSNEYEDHLSWFKIIE